MTNSTAEVTVLTHPTVTLDKVPKMLSIFFAQDLSVFLLSIPGLGKTSIAHKVGKIMGAEVITMVASVRDRLDLGGLPFVSKNEDGTAVAKFAPMQLMAHLSNEQNPKGGPVILYLNEAPHAPESLQPVLYRLVNERAVEGLTLRKNVHIMADGNPASAVGAGRELQMPLRRRFMWLSIKESIPVWSKWANEEGEIDGRIISFLNYSGFEKHFCNFNPKAREKLTYSTPASWHNLSKVLVSILDAFPDKLDRGAMFAGVVGAEAGDDFAAYINSMGKLPDIDEILKNPEKANLKFDDPSLVALLCGGVLNKVVADPKLVPQALKLCIRFIDSKGDTGYPEFGTFLGRSMAQRKELRQKLFNCKEADKLAAALREEKEYFDALLVAQNSK